MGNHPCVTHLAPNRRLIRDEAASRDRAGLEPLKCSTLSLLPSKKGKEKGTDLRTFRWMESVWTGSDENLLRFFNSESESKSTSVVKQGVRFKLDLWIN